jgi:sugar O-acyltransferase (sialic acid O-acetyltransferase NeuD family)
MDDEIIIFGVGETALLAYEYFTHDSPYKVVAFAADSQYIQQEKINGIDVVDINDIGELFPSNKYLGFVAASSTSLNRVRNKQYTRVKSLGYQLVSYISSKAFVWHNCVIGENCFILENNTLQPYTEIGNNVVMWSGNHLGHRSLIKDNCFISSHCVISGYCVIEENCFLGVNSTIENNIVISKDSFIGAGAIIRKNTAEKSFMQSPATEAAKADSHKIFRIKEF